MKIKYRNHIEKNSRFWQLTTPYISIFRERGKGKWNVCVTLGVIVGDLEFWFGNDLDELV